MRVKVQSVPPLPPTKAWLSVHSATNVLDLKSVLCQDLPLFYAEELQAADITLILDDFELLDSSPIDVVRDGDLIIIRRSHTVVSNKRKAAREGSVARKRAKQTHADLTHLRVEHLPTRSQIDGGTQAASPLTSESSDSDSDSDSSSNSSESDSDSSSSSESTSDEGEEDDSARSNEAQPVAFHLGQPRSKAVTKQVDKALSVPPGFGKPATHSRNLRRRRKRMYERLTATVEPKSVNEIPLGSRTQAAASSITTSQPSHSHGDNGVVALAATTTTTITSDGGAAAPVVMMASLQNKNKKKGFKTSMAARIPAKIVFPSEDVEVDSTIPAPEQDQDQDALPFTRTNNLSVFKTNPYFVPPSEKLELGLLPPNVFVTSVDVEEGLHPKKKRKRRQQIVAYEESTSEEVELPYDDVTDDVQSRPSVLSPLLDFVCIESRWTTLTKITALGQLKPQDLVAWKELGINPSTFTPEFLLNLGRVIKFDTEQLVIERIAGHGATQISFGWVVDEDEAENLEAVYGWSEVLQGDWRVVPGV